MSVFFFCAVVLVGVLKVLDRRGEGGRGGSVVVVEVFHHEQSPAPTTATTFCPLPRRGRGSTHERRTLYLVRMYEYCMGVRNDNVGGRIEKNWCRRGEAR